MKSMVLLMTLIEGMLVWRSFLDILLIAAVIFFFYRMLLRLGSWKIMIGIILAWAIFGAASYLNLKGTKWIYSNVSQVAVIGLVVIFQPELRKILERAASIRSIDLSKGADSLPAMIGQSIFVLAERKTGAILVFPGKEPLRRWLSGGTAIQAVPSFPLIMSIFDPHSPGHDGAVLIEKGKITYFGLHLPMSKSNKLGENYGTRHHAALGLTEMTDAMTVVVSEERGTVTVFRDGTAETMKDKEELADRLIAHWKELSSLTGEIRGSKKKVVALWLEIGLSLLLASVFWFAVTFANNEVSIRRYTATIEYNNIPKELKLTGSAPSETKVQITGSKSDLDSINPASLSVKVNLANTKPGLQTFIVTEENLKLPKGVNLLDADPSKIELSLAEVVEKELPITAQLVGELPPGFILKGIEIFPKHINVLSPGDEGLQDVQLMTTPIYLSSITKSSSIYCKIIAPPSLQPIEKKWPDVLVILTVGQEGSESSAGSEPGSPQGKKE